MNTPIITPVIINNTKECIIQNGVKFCEDQDITNKEIGVVLLSTLGFFMYVALAFKVGDMVEDKYGVEALKTLLVLLAAPLLIIGLILYF
jgi:uncharacterized PurR-regulated membrane protein YhhQ (DUF165 family)